MNKEEILEIIADVLDEADNTGCEDCYVISDHSVKKLEELKHKLKQELGK